MSVPQQGINCKNEMDLKYTANLEENEKILGNEDSLSNDGLHTGEENSELEPIKNTEQPPEGSLNLPMLNKIHTNVEKMFNNIMKQNSLLKYLDQKKMHRCNQPLCKVGTCVSN